jgi:hypothetical protein
MKMGYLLAMVSLLAILVSPVSADQVDLREFGLISVGMSEAEVLVRLGPPDHESFEGFSPAHLLIKSYFYFSEAWRHQDITTVIRFEGGRVIHKERIYR